MMGSLSGILRIPIVAATSVAVASVSTDLPDRLLASKAVPSPSPRQSKFSLCNSARELKSSWVSHMSSSNLSNFSCVMRIRAPIPNINFSILNQNAHLTPSSISSPIASSPVVLLNLYRSAELARAPKPAAFTYGEPSTPPDDLYRWHLPEQKAYYNAGNSECSSAKSRTVVVLIGWLGAKQKHLKRYAEWYTSMGFHAITFTLPMGEILSYQVGGKAEQNVDLLVRHLADWLEEEHGKNLVFHTFSNTGWLTYGAILEKFQKQDSSLMGRIKGCVVDSAPVAAPDPQVWASGFSAAFLKKHSIATKGSFCSDDSGVDLRAAKQIYVDPKPAVAEAALQLLLEKFFKVVLNLPTVNRRLSDVLNVLSSGQPTCPQLYIYSSADRVIPVRSVESFIEAQRKAGRDVRACNFVSTPHVDHFRNDPKLYTSQLSQFFEDCVLTICKGSS